MEPLTYSEFNKTADHDQKWGRKGWTKAKCNDDKCNTITVWNTKQNGRKCNDGICGKCGGSVKRTVWSTTHNYIVTK